MKGYNARNNKVNIYINNIIHPSTPRSTQWYLSLRFLYIYIYKPEGKRPLIYIYKPEGKRPLGRPRRRWVDNIRMDLQEVGCGYVDWIGLAQDRGRWRTLVSAVMNLRVK